MMETINFQDIQFSYKDKKRVLKLSEHLQLTGFDEILKELSRYRYYEDYFVFLYQSQKFDSKRIYTGLDKQKREVLRELEMKSRDEKGKAAFKVTESMIEGEVTTDPLYIKTKQNLADTLFTLNRVRSAINLLEWKLCFMSNGFRKPGIKHQEEIIPSTQMSHVLASREEE